MNTERYCTIEESIIESFKEVKLMREGKIPKQSWEDTRRKIEKTIEEVKAENGI